MARLEQLATFSEEADCLTRTYLTAQQRAAGKQLIAWMQEAGMQAGFDPVGNVVGRYEGQQANAPALLIGSHFDTVRNAGKYDGGLGIISAISCIKTLHDAGESLPFAIEVLAFADEEGVRFGATLLGSRAIAGSFDFTLLDNADNAGITMAEAIREYGLDPANIASAARTPGQALAYIEVHIEQGPVLLSEALPVGIVTAIAGASRFQIIVQGQAGHAGTVPMSLRHDAATAAAEALLFIEQRCQQDQTNGLVGTVGQLQIPNGATNVIPGNAEFTIDIRAGDDTLRTTAVNDVIVELHAIGERRGVEFKITKTHDASACSCAPWLTAQLESAVSSQGISPRFLPSGAGHDAMAMAKLTDVAMLFVRCGNGGISHHPDEIMTVEDAEISTAVLLDFIRGFEAGTTL